MSDKDSLVSRARVAAHASAWRFFRGSATDILDLVPFLAKLQELASGSSSLILLSDDCFVCFIEPEKPSSSPINYRGVTITVGYTESAEAITEFHGWTAKALMTGFAAEAVPNIVSLLRSAERAVTAEVASRVVTAFQFEERPELEFELWRRNLVHSLKGVSSAEMWQIRPRVPADFWESRGVRWTWKYSDDLPADPPVIDSRILSEVGRAGLIECRPSDSKDVESVILVPLKNRATVLGVLALYFTRPVVILPGEMKLLELLQRELTAVMERTRNRLRMQRMATIDGLTNLFNHRFFHTQLRIEFQRALRYQKKMALVMIDIDDFKRFNDHHGHLAGDRALAEVGRVIRAKVRDIDVVARYGGEEFALILPEVDSNGGLIVAEKVRIAIGSHRFRTESGEDLGSITVSCGVTDNENTTSPSDLIRRADRALYWVKTHGRNLVRLADPIDDA